MSRCQLMSMSKHSGSTRSTSWSKGLDEGVSPILGWPLCRPRPYQIHYEKAPMLLNIKSSLFYSILIDRNKCSVSISSIELGFPMSYQVLRWVCSHRPRQIHRRIFGFKQFVLSVLWWVTSHSPWQIRFWQIRPWRIGPRRVPKRSGDDASFRLNGAEGRGFRGFRCLRLKATLKATLNARGWRCLVSAIPPFWHWLSATNR